MNIKELFNVEYPILQGAMAHIATPEFAAAVSNAGALGIIATGAMDSEQVKKAIVRCKELTDKPFGVNLMLMNPHSDAIVEEILKNPVAFVTTGAGNPGKYCQQLKAAGIKIYPVVNSVALAKRLVDNGVDGIIAEGTESGGHVGELTTMALVPQMVQAVNVPVIAAGGIACGAQLNACLALGAVGVQIGTRFLVSEECPVHENYQQAVIKAKDLDTVVTGRNLGAPVRILKNQMALQYRKLEMTNADKEELEIITLGALRRAVFEGDMKHGSVMMGQVAGLCKKIQPIKEILDELMQEAKENKMELNKIWQELSI
ncbi:MAG: nitronate monooxygenase [Longicatena sp.]|jgi:enoyl-[acyl-carrier protein] reductase II|uniref:nitronate monooxygenase n=1 Tax=Anaerorhabdus sp. TaxID=1872524 RepID=UPI002FCB7997